MSKTKEIQTAEHGDTALQTIGNTNPIQAMLQAVTEKGITSENAAALEKLTDLFLKVEAVNARKAFFDAKAAMQAELPAIVATRMIPRSGKPLPFSNMGDILKVVRPLMKKYGFSESFSSEVESAGTRDRIVAIMTLSKGGHSEQSKFAVRSSGPPGCSDAQGDGSTFEYAKRYAFCAAFNISIDKDFDGDARLEGGPITVEQAVVLESRLKAVGGDVARFLKLGGASSKFTEIKAGKLRVLEDMLALKEQDMKTKAAKPQSATMTDEEKQAILAQDRAGK